MTARSSFVRRLQLGLGVLVAITLAGLAGILAAERRVASALDRSHVSLSLLDDFKEVEIQLAAARAAEQEFVREDLHTPNFFESGSSEALDRHAAALAALDSVLARLADQPAARALGASDIQAAIDDYREGFAAMAVLYRERGWYYLGLMGEMHDASYAFMDRLGDGANALALRVGLLELLQDRDTYAHDHDTRASYMVTERLGMLHEDVDARGGAKAKELHGDLEQFKEAWTRLSEIDEQIGLSVGSGLRGRLTAAQAKVTPLTLAAVKRAREDFEDSRRELARATATARLVSAGAVLAAVVVAAFLAVSLGAHLRRSLAQVLAAVEAYAGGDRSARVGRLATEDEFSVLGGAFDAMAENLAEATEELEEINASLKLAVKGDTAGLLERIQALVADRHPSDAESASS